MMQGQKTSNYGFRMYLALWYVLDFRNKHL